MQCSQYECWQFPRSYVFGIYWIIKRKEFKINVLSNQLYPYIWVCVYVYTPAWKYEIFFNDDNDRYTYVFSESIVSKYFRIVYSNSQEKKWMNKQKENLFTKNP